jgi:hypothetical protein
MRREKAYYVVSCRVGEADKWQPSGWWEFHSGPNYRYAKKMCEQAKKSYAHWPRLGIRLQKWVRPRGPGAIGWMSERRP